MSGRRLETRLLLRAGRLLLKYNEATEAIQRTLAATARALTEDACHVAVSYHGVAVALGEEPAALEAVCEIRYNTAVQARVHEVLERLRRGQLVAPAALGLLETVEADTPRHPRWLTVLLLGAAAAGLAVLLGADGVAAGVAGLATALGLLARQELAGRHFNLLGLPLAAALIGAVLGGLAVRQGWTRTPGLVLVVPALMLVPGPHLINGLLDLVDNQVPMAVYRLVLAAGILVASALGIVLGVEMVLPGEVLPEQGPRAYELNLVSDMALAGVAACGFAAFYNTPWRPLGLATLGGMVGHGLRFLALRAGSSLEVATFLGGLTVGAVAAWTARSAGTPVAAIAFAGAVTMIPGLSIYRALGGALRLARLPEAADAAALTGAVSQALHGGLVLGGLALGVIVAARVVAALAPGRPG